VPEAVLVENHGIDGDAHAGPGRRQISLLAGESVDKIRGRIEGGICFGKFAENITTRGIGLSSLPVGTRLRLGNTAVIEITQIGKECHNDCEIKRLAGECVMPNEGVFGIVIAGERIRKNDGIVIT